MEFGNREFIGRGLDILRDALIPYVQEKLKAHYADEWWIRAIEPAVGKKDIPTTGNTLEERFAALDVPKLRRIMLHVWEPVFKDDLGESGRSLISQVSSVRNPWAHQADFDDSNGYDALSHIATLLRLIKADDKRLLIQQLQKEMGRNQVQKARVRRDAKNKPRLPFASPKDFVGRTLELNRLQFEIHEGQPGVIVSGSGGFGKTTLVTRLAEQIKRKYPDGQLYLDLKGAGIETALSTREIAVFIIQTLEPQPSVPDDESELIALYQRVAFEKTVDGSEDNEREPRRIMLFLDNVATAEQVRGLVPPNTASVMLLASRQQFDLRGFYSLSLDALPHDEAVRLLMEIAHSVLDESQADTIATLLGDYPLALVQAGRYLAEDIDADPDEYVTQLQQQSLQRFTLIERSLRLSYEALMAELQTVWHRIAVFSGTFDAQAAAAVCNLDPATASARVNSLARRSLVKYRNPVLGNQKVRRYYLHDLHREFALHQMTPEEREQTVRQHAFYFLETAITATRDLSFGDDKAEKQALELFDWDWENYEAAWRWTSERADSDLSVAHLCYGYLDLGWSLITQRRPANEWIEWLGPALADAQQSGDTRAELRRTYRLATAYEAAKEFSHAVILYEQALVLARNLNSPALPIVLMSLGKVLIHDLENMSNYVSNVVSSHYGPHFVGYGKAAWELEGIPEKIIPDKSKYVWFTDLDGELLLDFENTDTGEIDVVLLRQQSTMAYRQGERAITLFVEAVQIWHGVGDEWRELEALVQVAETYASLDDLEAAVEKYQQARALAQKVDPDDVGQIIWKLGNCYAGLGHHFFYAQELQKAVECYEQSITLFSEVDASQLDISMLCSLTVALIQLGNWEAAQDYQILLENQLIYSERSGSRWEELCDPYWTIGAAYARAGQEEHAAESLKQCFVFALFHQMPETREYLYRLVDEFVGIRKLVEEVIAFCRQQLREEVWYNNKADYAFYDSLSWQIVLIYERLGEYDKAIADAEECVGWDIEAEQPEAGEHMAYLESLRLR